MKLSEAIRAGAKIRPQAYEYLFGAMKGEIGSCALGAAAEGAGIVPIPIATEAQYVVYGAMEGEWPELLTDSFPCPANDDEKNCPIVPEIDADGDEVIAPEKLESLIEHLNDNHKWTREQIADYVESLGY